MSRLAKPSDNAEVGKAIVNDIEALRESVVQAIQSSHFTVVRLEELTGISKTHIADIKNRKRPGSLETLMRLATFFQIKFRFDSLP